MKKITYILASLSLVLTGCLKTEKIDVPVDAVTIIEAYCADDTKSTLDLSTYHVDWSIGDVIKINGKRSEPLKEGDIEGRSAKFTLPGVLEAPYYGVYNGESCGEFVEGDAHCIMNLESPETYVEDSFDPKFATYWGVNQETPKIQFNHAMAYVAITPTKGSAPDAKISYIKLTSRSGSETLSGHFTLSFEDGSLTPVEGYEGNKDYVVMQAPEEGVALGKPFVIAVPAQTYSAGLFVEIVATDCTFWSGKLKAFKAEAGTIYPIEAPFNPKGTIPATAEACEVSSSTACFTWTLGKGADFDIAKAWTIQLATDAEFSEEGVVTREISEGNENWRGLQPKFCFGGLEQDTQYFFRACITGQDNWSDVVSATTTTFDLRVVTENAHAGDVILAEDFHESAEGGENVAKAAGWGAKQDALKKYTDAGTTMNNESAWSAWSEASFGKWGWTRASGGATFYPNQGHIKLGREGDNSQMITSKLSAITGYADIEVEVTAASYPDSRDQKNLKEFFIAPLKGELNANHTIEITSLNLPGKVVVPMGDNTKWETYKATLYGIEGTDRLVIGSNYDTGCTRLLVSDVKVTVKSIPTFVAKATETSSSTVSFTWGHPELTAADDANRKYEFGLYKDATCTEVVVSYSIDAQPDADTKDGHKGAWKQRKPKFCFGGLEPSTTYYFKVKDVKSNVESVVVSSTTDAFSCKKMPSTAETGDIILAEDFSEVFLGGEPVIAAAAACKEYTETNVFETLSGKFPVCVFNADSDEKALTDATALSGKRLEKWSYAKNGSSGSMYAHVGCVKLGTSSYNTWITTPVLSAIPANKKATLEVTVTIAAWSGAKQTGFVYAGKINNKATISSETSLIKSTSMATSSSEWKTFTVTLTGVDNTMRLAIGPDINTDNTPLGKGRMVVNDVVVKIKSLK